MIFELKRMQKLAGLLKESESNEIEVILSKNQDLDDVEKLLKTDKKANNLNLSHLSYGKSLGSIGGHLISMFFNNTAEEVKDFIIRNNIKIANKSDFDLN